MTPLQAVAEAFRIVGEIIANFVSASQIDKWIECERKWGWRYVARFPDPPGGGALLGTECDDTQLQPYLRDDRPIDYSRRSGYIVQPGLAYLPKPKAQGIELQRYFVLPSPTTPLLAFQGYIDLWAPDGSVIPDVAYDPEQLRYGRHDSKGRHPPVVEDFKTTGNWKYQKKAKQLETDTQAQLYAKWATTFTGVRVVDLIWVYFGTKGAYKAKRSHLRVTADQIDVQFARINAIAETIHKHRKLQTHPLQLAPNVDACGKFGGCPYEAKCNLSPSQNAAAAQHARRMDIDMSNAATSTADLLARLKGQQTGAPSVTITQMQPPAIPPPAPSSVAAPADLAAHVAENPRAAFLLAPAALPVALGVNPPESKLPPAPPVGSVAAPPPAVEGEKPKAGPGRPRKPAKDPVGADAAMHTSGPVTNNIMTVDGGTGFVTRSVRAVWAQETYCPVAFNPFVVGPFEATGPVLAGESFADAHARIYAELVTFAENARAEKAVSFQKTLAAMGGGR